jgi:hypothetical protein
MDAGVTFTHAAFPSDLFEGNGLFLDIKQPVKLAYRAVEGEHFGYFASQAEKRILD